MLLMLVLLPVLQSTPQDHKGGRLLTREGSRFRRRLLSGGGGVHLEGGWQPDGGGVHWEDWQHDGGGVHLEDWQHDDGGVHFEKEDCQVGNDVPLKEDCLPDSDGGCLEDS